MVRQSVSLPCQPPPWISGVEATCAPARASFHIHNGARVCRSSRTGLAAWLSQFLSGYSSPPALGEPARKCGRKSFDPTMPTKFLSAPVMPVFMCVLSLGTFRITSALSTVLLTPQWRARLQKLPHGTRGVAEPVLVRVFVASGARRAGGDEY